VILEQIGLSAVFYLSIVLLFRLAGRRLAGQTTTFDLIVLISLAVSVQQATLLKGAENVVTFVLTVFSLHWINAKLCAYSPWARYLLRGLPCQLVCDGVINQFSRLRTLDSPLSAGCTQFFIEGSA